MATYSCIGLGEKEGVGLQHRRPMFEYSSFTRFGALMPSLMPKLSGREDLRVLNRRQR